MAQEVLGTPESTGGRCSSWSAVAIADMVAVPGRLTGVVGGGPGARSHLLRLLARELSRDGTAERLARAPVVHHLEAPEGTALLIGSQSAAALALPPISRARVLLLDDPVAGLGAQPRCKVLRVCRRLADRGAAVVMATEHVLDIEAAQADRAVVLDGHQPVAVGPVEQVLRIEGRGTGAGGRFPRS